MSNVVDVKDLEVVFQLKDGMFKEKKQLCALDGVSFSIPEGDILALVGESGSGKTTTGKAILQLVRPTAGTIDFYGEQLDYDNKKQLHDFRLKAQMIYQDPYQSLNPRDVIGDIVAEPLDVNGLVSDVKERETRVIEALENAGMTPARDYLRRYPYELSGGQRQRVVIASTMILKPKFVVADEPVSMLDASIRTGILRLMLKMRDENALSYLFITHDLSLAWLLANRIAIMYLGRIVEIGRADEIIAHGQHPYTRALIEIMPVAGKVRTGERKLLPGEVANAVGRIAGCCFAGRCPEVEERCRTGRPTLTDTGGGHLVACHHCKGNG